MGQTNIVYIILGFVVYFQTATAWAVTGGHNEVQKMPPQLCQIAPIRGGRIIGDMVCSGLIVGPRQISFASHCAFLHSDAFIVDCVGENGSITVPKSIRDASKIRDSNGPVPMNQATYEYRDLAQDLAILTVNVDFKTPPIEVDSATTIEELKAGDECYFAATGTDEAGQYGRAQYKKVKAENFEEQTHDGILITRGFPYIAAHDSGGGLVCNGKLVGTTVAAMNEGTQVIADNGNQVAVLKNPRSIVALFNSDTNRSWLQESLNNNEVVAKFCDANSTSKALADAIPHVLGFEEIREFFVNQKGSGLDYCFEGLTLEVSNYHYFKNFISVRLFNPKDPAENVKRLSIWFQTSSVQGYHNVGLRPWVVIDSHYTDTVFDDLVGKFAATKSATFDSVTAVTIADIQAKTGLLPASAQQASIMFLESRDGQDYYLMSWIQNVGGADLYTQAYSPRMVVFKRDQQRNLYEFGNVQAAYDPLLKNFQNALKPLQQYINLDVDQQVQLIDTLIY